MSVKLYWNVQEANYGAADDVIIRIYFSVSCGYLQVHKLHSCQTHHSICTNQNLNCVLKRRCEFQPRLILLSRARHP